MAREFEITDLEAVVLAGESPTGAAKPIAVDADGKIILSADIAFENVNIGDVEVSASALPTGAATSAKQDSLINLLPAAFSTGGGVKVGLVDALPAGTNNIGDVDVASLPSLPAGTNNIGDVDVASLPALAAGTNSIGAVTSNSVVVAATITRPSDTNAYIAKDVVCNSTSSPAVLEWAGMARANGGTGTIVRARLMTSQKTNVALFRLHLFHTTPLAINDNAPYTMLYSNAANRIGCIDFPALGTEDSSGSTAAASMRPSYDGSYNAPNLWYKCAANDTKLYGILETLSAFTPDSGQTFYIELGADGLN